MTSLSEERMKILKMLEEGKITAEEATTLLRALDGGQRATSKPTVGSDNRFLRIHVSDLTTGRTKVNVTIPIGLVGVGLRLAERFAPGFEDFDMQQLEEMLTSGVVGKMVEVSDEEEGEQVEIYVE